ncbi:MAG: hypothetical protein ACR2N2_06570 [Acidimicrobiia bacterium]
MTQSSTNEDVQGQGESSARKIPAGIADAGFASLATFAAGLSAVTLFNDVDRGVYALFFAAFSLGVVLPWNLVLVPAEVNAVSYALADRMRRAKATLRMGLGLSLVGSLAVLAAAFLARDLTDPDVLIMLTVTAMVTTVLSPLQDHIRRLLHISELSWRAAIVSIVQFSVVAIALSVMWLVDAPLALMPFGSLALANAASLAVGLVLARVFRQKPLEDKLSFWYLASEGRWLLAQAIVPSLAHFAVAAIVAALAGAIVLGYAEAARVVAQPVLVFATGLTAVLAPRAMRAAMDIDISSARYARRVFLGLVTAAGLVYLLWASTDWFGNPMAYIVPAAYVVPGLVAAMIVANIATASLYLDSNEFLGARMARQLSLLSILLSPILVLFAFTAGTTGAFAIPIGRTVRISINIVLLRVLLSRYYGTKGYLWARGESKESVASEEVHR